MPVMRALCLRSGDPALWKGRLGRVGEEISSQAPWDIWIQAVSVGEVGVAWALVQAVQSMEPGLKILVSSSTAAGYERACETLGDRCGVIPYPFDFPQAVSLAAHAVKPRVFACIETELWPSMLMEMRKRGAATVLLNGRISTRSFPRYMKIRPVIAGLLKDFSVICASSPVSSQRLLELGAPEDRLILTGNAKYEALLDRPDPGKALELARLLGIPPGARVMVAGSVRGGDEPYIMEAWKILEKRFPDLCLVVVPRHLKNVTMLERLFQRESMPMSLYSTLLKGESPTRSRVVLVDRIGPLFDLYGTASVAFVGGSMSQKGGQNILEPAAWACPVLYGPYTDNFEDAVSALDKEGAGGMVRDGKELASRVTGLLSDIAAANAVGKAARRALENIAAGAATRQAEVLVRLWSSRA
jgi:3-deoxy-D-manno-octulosonic-acid transferase